MLYISALHNAESYLGDLIKNLVEQGIKDDTLLILFGDHGESLTEHDIFWKLSHPLSLPQKRLKISR